ncbi:MAG: methyltransferase [Pseudomonadota bacterium]
MPDAGGSAAPAPGPQAPLSLWDRVLGWRDRMLARPGFHRFAARFPLTRPMVRAESRALFDLCSGFVYAQTLAACVELDLFRQLADGPREVSQLAEANALPEGEMQRLLQAAEALRLVARRSAGRWGLGQLGAAVNGTPGLAEMIRHHALFYRDMADPVALLRAEGQGAELNRYWTYARGGPVRGLSADQVTEYSELMAASQRMLSDDILDAAGLDRTAHLMDVGAGAGTFGLRAAERLPRLRLTLFDLPEVAALAANRVAEAGFADRIACQGGDFRNDPLPRGADTISLIRVLYDHPEATAQMLLEKARAALPPGGRLIIAEPMDGAGGEARVGAAYFGFYLLAMGGGRARHPAEFTEMLRAAGFERIRLHRTAKPMLARVMSARAPR